jgi:hypothetical protein
MPSEPQEIVGIGNGVIIGLVSGGAAVVALLIAAGIYIVRSRRLELSSGGERATTLPGKTETQIDESDSSDGDDEIVPELEDDGATVLETLDMNGYELPDVGPENEMWL